MPLPTEGPASRSVVKALLGIAAGDTTQDDEVDLRVAAANAWVRGLPVCDRADTDPAPVDWSGVELSGIVLGANQLAARLYRRKDSPEGVSVVGATSPVYVLRDDPDIAQLLQVGAYEKPAVG